jgi:hypothetical protein
MALRISYWLSVGCVLCVFSCNTDADVVYAMHSQSGSGGNKTGSGGGGAKTGPSGTLDGGNEVDPPDSSVPQDFWLDAGFGLTDLTAVLGIVCSLPEEAIDSFTKNACWFPIGLEDEDIRPDIKQMFDAAKINGETDCEVGESQWYPDNPDNPTYGVWCPDSPVCSGMKERIVESIKSLCNPPNRPVRRRDS